MNEINTLLGINVFNILIFPCQNILYPRKRGREEEAEWIYETARAGYILNTKDQ
jgi:hypothetical protein